ncbi:hypothetical protein VOI54_15120 [Tamlana sp. 2201CG12-4]|uniref:hypothetical protein n=1 Tax=Tamlana sp. 2201CG12-4 TaxID=3112582 RepID=UPI002DB6EDDB|nr:hypothetical protein [Tamlana sp. 2201CG12-4]MEC3908360.1 hypothetical protein [Tamlana sp. 2201CG12-4]
MNKLILNLGIALILVCVASCSSDDVQNENDSNIQGVWKLSAWNIVGGFDMNNDGVVHTNLLNEIDCTKNETLLFEPNGIVSLNTTFSPDIEIALLDEETNTYSFDVTCDTEGIISLATSYKVNGNHVEIGEIDALIEGNQISIVFEKSLEIYNSDLTQIIETKDLTLVYVKQ